MGAPVVRVGGGSLMGAPVVPWTAGSLMLLVPCPQTAGRATLSDLRYGGESHPRPDPATATPQQWRGYLYLRDNPAGWLRENWYCRSGCRRWFTVERNTATNEFRNPPMPGDKRGGKA